MNPARLLACVWILWQVTTPYRPYERFTLEDLYSGQRMYETVAQTIRYREAFATKEGCLAARDAVGPSGIQLLYNPGGQERGSDPHSRLIAYCLPQGTPPDTPHANP